MRRIFLAAAALAGVLSGQPPGGFHMPLDTRVWVVAKLYSAIQMYFAHGEGAPEFDLDRDYKEYLKAAFVADDRRQFDLATIAFMGKLRNGHSMFYDQWLQEHRTWRDFRYTTPLFNGHVGAENQIRTIYPQASSDPYLRGYLNAFEEFRDAQMLTIAPVHPPAPDAYKGKVYVLIDGFCGSACDDFAEAFKTSGRGMLIGEATSGSSGQPYYFDFRNGMSFRVSSKRYYLPDGTPFEGVGILPDVEVRSTLAELKAGRDAVLEKAIELAAKN